MLGQLTTTSPKTTGIREDFFLLFVLDGMGRAEGNGRGHPAACFWGNLRETVTNEKGHAKT
jgi:hypothetical protein